MSIAVNKRGLVNIYEFDHEVGYYDHVTTTPDGEVDNEGLGTSLLFDGQILLAGSPSLLYNMTSSIGSVTLFHVRLGWRWLP